MELKTNGKHSEEMKGVRRDVISTEINEYSKKLEGISGLNETYQRNLIGEILAKITVNTGSALIMKKYVEVLIEYPERYGPASESLFVLGHSVGKFGATENKKAELIRELQKSVKIFGSNRVKKLIQTYTAKEFGEYGGDFIHRLPWQIHFDVRGDKRTEKMIEIYSLENVKKTIKSVVEWKARNGLTGHYNDAINSLGGINSADYIKRAEKICAIINELLKNDTKTSDIEKAIGGGVGLIETVRGLNEEDFDKIAEILEMYATKRIEAFGTAVEVINNVLKMYNGLSRKMYKEEEEMFAMHLEAVKLSIDEPIERLEDLGKWGYKEGSFGKIMGAITSAITSDERMTELAMKIYNARRVERH